MPLTIEENKSHRKKKFAKNKKKISTDEDNEKYYKVRNHICNLRYKTQKKILYIS